MNVGSRSEAASRDRAYDFDRLERSVDFLIHEHERLSGEREALLAELLDREHRIAKLEAKLVADQGKRAEAIEGVEKILVRLEQLQTVVTAKVTCQTAPNTATHSSNNNSNNNPNNIAGSAEVHP